LDAGIDRGRTRKAQAARGSLKTGRGLTQADGGRTQASLLRPWLLRDTATAHGGGGLGKPGFRAWLGRTQAGSLGQCGLLARWFT
jgi:hypothetical protein